jgi:hypothetical protein
MRFTTVVDLDPNGDGSAGRRRDVDATDDGARLRK